MFSFRNALVAELSSPWPATGISGGVLPIGLPFVGPDPLASQREMPAWLSSSLRRCADYFWCGGVSVRGQFRPPQCNSGPKDGWWMKQIRCQQQSKLDVELLSINGMEFRAGVATPRPDNVEVAEKCFI